LLIFGVDRFSTQRKRLALSVLLWFYLNMLKLLAFHTTQVSDAFRTRFNFNIAIEISRGGLFLYKKIVHRVQLCKFDAAETRRSVILNFRI
jgi:hypothetical protein